MRTASSLAGPNATVLERAIDFERELSPTAARALLQIRFAYRQHERMSALLEKSRSGTLTAREEEEIDTYERLGCLIGILHSRARQALNKRAGDA